MIVGMLFLVTQVGFGCAGRESGAFSANNDSPPSRSSPDFVTLAKKLQPIVVNVSTTQMVSKPAPINLIKELLPQLEAKGKVTRGWVGIAIQQVTPDLAKAFGLEKPHGALVAKVLTGGPAERGGIKVGDIITEYDGEQVAEANEFPLMVART
jgi:serine protease Do